MQCLLLNLASLVTVVAVSGISMALFKSSNGRVQRILVIVAYVVVGMLVVSWLVSLRPPDCLLLDQD